MSAESNERALSVLVVDDDPHLRSLTVFALGLDPSLEVRACESGEAALEELRARTADIVLLDLEMPGLGGSETARRIAASTGGKAVVILVTGRQNVDDAVAHGTRGVIRKPFDPVLLASEVRRLWAMSSSLPEDRYLAVMEAFVPGEVIDGKYRIDGFLGAGGMATVFRGHDVMLERPVAIKVLHAGDAELLRAEARAMARLRHENVVQVFSFGVHHELGFIAMELVEGTNLQEMIDRQVRIPPIAAIGVLEKIAAGLDAAHAEGIIHHDVKPANVLVGPRYRVCVTDFGLTDAVTNVDSLNGTPAYMAPERFMEASRDEAHLSDQYALGVTAYEMLTGRLPFEQEDLGALIRCQMQERPPPMATAAVPRAVEVVVMRALAKNPAERFPSCTAFARALKHASTSTAPERTGPEILIVDDDPSLVALFTAVIADAVPSARIASANDGLVALEIARAAPPALILLDLQMPRLSGMEFLHQLQGEKNMTTARIVAISSLLGKERPVRGGVHIGVMLRTLGVAEQLGKPVDPHQLVEVVKRQLALSPKEP